MTRANPTVASLQRGAPQFGVGCLWVIRNQATRETADWPPQEALERLAALSVLARLIDMCEVVTYQPDTDTGRLHAYPTRPLSANAPVTCTVPDLISFIAAYHATGPRAETNVPVGPSGPICAIRTMIAAPTSTVWMPVRPLRSVLV